jgi:putative NIF3 family GTP cyclohydrolase 1 type 2
MKPEEKARRDIDERLAAAGWVVQGCDETNLGTKTGALGMTLDELKQKLDGLFAISEWGQDPAMNRWVPRAYQSISYDYTRILEPEFCVGFNGLMLRSAETVEQVYCAAFPCPEIVGAVLERAKGNALLFVHHPVDMEVSGTGFLPIPSKALEQMKARGVSIYSCHAPLDCHDEIGTNASIVQAFQMQVEQSFVEYGTGFAGRLGVIRSVSVDELIAKGKGIFGVERVEVGGARLASITRVAIVAGGGDDVDVMEEVEGLGAEAYISGEWYTRTTPSGESGRRWAEANRAACQMYAESSKMALLGFSHAATEFLVMRNQMADWFRRGGFQVECLEQSDWWR